MPETPVKTWTIRDLLTITAPYLEKKGVESPRLTAEVLLARLLGTDRVGLYLHFDQPLTQKEISDYRNLVRRRVAREPLQHITGHQEFWSLDFAVDRRALIPRPETELLVERAIDIIRAGEGTEIDSPAILDLGTGAGPIAVSLAKEIPTARIVATDISADALEVARLNAETHRVLERIALRTGDLWKALKDTDGPFDLILSNPPYIADEEFSELAPEVRDFEPDVALRGYEEGFRIVERIIRGALSFMRTGGWMLLEMAPSQTDRALSLIEQIRGYGDGSKIRDYFGRFRVVLCRKA